MFLLLHIFRHQKLCEMAAPCLLVAAPNALKFSPHPQQGTSITNASSPMTYICLKADNIEDKVSWELSSLTTRSKFLLWLTAEEKRSDNHVGQHCSLWRRLRILKIYAGNAQEFVDTQLKKLQFTTRIAEISLNSSTEKKRNNYVLLCPGYSLR